MSLWKNRLNSYGANHEQKKGVFDISFSNYDEFVF